CRRGGHLIGGSRQRDLRALTAQIEHDALHARSHLLGAEAELLAHLQHARVFGQYVAIDAPQACLFGVVDDTVHQYPAEPVTLEARAHQVANSAVCSSSSSFKRTSPSMRPVSSSSPTKATLCLSRWPSLSISSALSSAISAKNRSRRSSALTSARKSRYSATSSACARRICTRSPPRTVSCNSFRPSSLFCGIKRSSHAHSQSALCPFARISASIDKGQGLPTGPGDQGDTYNARPRHSSAPRRNLR